MTANKIEVRLDQYYKTFYICATNFATLAQLVEQRIRNAWVGGSSPLGGSSIWSIAEISNGPFLFIGVELDDYPAGEKFIPI